MAAPAPRSPPAPSHPRLWVFAAAVLWSTSGLFAKAPVFATWDAGDRGLALAFWRALFAGLLILPAVRQPTWSLRLALPALSFAAMNTTFLLAMALTTAANATWLQSTAPLWVFLIGTAFLGEPLVRRHLLALGLAVAGIGWILHHEFIAGAWLGVSCGLLSGVTFGAVVVSLRVLRRCDGAWLIVVNHLTAAAVMLPFVIARGLWPTPLQLLVLAAFGFFQMGLPYTMFARGVRGVSSQEASLLALTEPLLVPLWVWLSVREVPASWTVQGAGLILVGLLVRFGLPASLRTRRDRRRTP